MTRSYATKTRLKTPFASLSAIIGEDAGPKDKALVVYWRIGIDNEIMHVVASRPRISATDQHITLLKVIRGAEGTTAAEHLEGAELDLNPPFPS